jgi:hypothetical protein
VSYELAIYLKTFPNEGKRILEQYGRTVSIETQINENEKEGWTQEQVTVPILSK